MKYCRYFFTALLLLSGPALSWCKLESPGTESQQGQVLMSNQNMFPGGQQVAVPLPLFSKQTLCSAYGSEQNEVHLGTPYERGVVIKFYDNVFIEITVQAPAQATIRLQEGSYTAAQFLDQLTVTARPVAPTQTTRLAPEGQYLLESAMVISASNGSSGSLGEFILRLLRFLLTGKWPASENDLYLVNLNLTLDYRATTCQFTDTLLTLPPVSISDLTQSGAIASPIADHTLVAQCDQLSGDGSEAQTNRTLRVTLSSDALLPENPRVVLPHSGPGGVGFILYDEQQRPITLGGAAAQPSVIRLIPRGTTLPDRGFRIPIHAGYYVHDRGPVRPGQLEANVTINIDYD
ncbi:MULTISPECIES: fimbrial protein [Edwardsiella]|uniref:Fimbrial-type adhesion domain-containing protein n=2 Tax=Edwardsiella anguillarum TaxID=1821960 RepID=A0A076LJF5_9GAMM|nr:MULTISPECIES: fimbrial protein [Edwardsiella]AKM47483.1 hypothetical protein QY76_09200 [Edwardsiella sp. EA181011]GAJ66178.1 hypothetical protein MA13_contig00001-0301 [Edwardsiella piscicida]AIJ06703.1 Hypothetical protein ETEE_0222 [Edwardsiella anguillarum ET080813]AKR78206.1 fimbrial protein [Edwardsiella sp. LADL05-105]KAB0593330.1 fimbrial protein [Edwardsiella anguillarum]